MNNVIDMDVEKTIKLAIDEFMNNIYNKQLIAFKGPNYCRIATLIFGFNGPIYILDTMLTGILHNIGANDALKRKQIYSYASVFTNELRAYYKENLDNILSKYTNKKSGFISNLTYLDFIKALRPRSARTILSAFNATELKTEIIRFLNKRPEYVIKPLYHDGILMDITYEIKG